MAPVRSRPLRIPTFGNSRRKEEKAFNANLGLFVPPLAQTTAGIEAFSGRVTFYIFRVDHFTLRRGALFRTGRLSSFVSNCALLAEMNQLFPIMRTSAFELRHFVVSFIRVYLTIRHHFIRSRQLIPPIIGKWAYVFLSSDSRDVAA